ncbi:hypothetical protein F5141DRAFT_1080851 [Pisolithus sp. B1]|nr:hypothetical protein F5141DRAFT_1080851 [Pisolithus sp. B1]
MAVPCRIDIYGRLRKRDPRDSGPRPRSKLTASTQKGCDKQQLEATKGFGCPSMSDCTATCRRAIFLVHTMLTPNKRCRSEYSTSWSWAGCSCIPHVSQESQVHSETACDSNEVLLLLHLGNTTRRTGVSIFNCHWVPLPRNWNRKSKVSPHGERRCDWNYR